MLANRSGDLMISDPLLITDTDMYTILTTSHNLLSAINPGPGLTSVSMVSYHHGDLFLYLHYIHFWAYFKMGCCTKNSPSKYAL